MQNIAARRVPTLTEIAPISPVPFASTSSHQSPKSAASSSEPSSPTLSHPPRRVTLQATSHGMLRSRSKSAASLADSNQNSRSYFTPSTTPLVGPAPPPRYQSEEDEESRDVVWTGLRRRNPYVTARFRGISTGHGTETEDPDEPSRPLPTARIVPPSPIAPSNRLQPFLFQAFRLLSIVPAVVGTLVHIYRFFYPPPEQLHNCEIDFAVAVCWGILTAYQHLCLTTGLLIRWRHHYAPFAVLIRLLGLQAICWPATHFTLQILGHDKRPVVCWAVIGSTTSFSRSIQMWVTSNLWVEPNERVRVFRWGDSYRASLRAGMENIPPKGEKRRWDWNKVMWRCVLPTGICYFIMAWADVIKRELGCYRQTISM